MMPPRSLLLTSAALGLAGGVAGWWWASDSVQDPPPVVSAKLDHSRSTVVPAVKPAAPATPGQSAKAGALELAPKADRAGVAAAESSGGFPGATAAKVNPRQPVPAVLTEQELQRRAARVEQQANHDLKRLVGLLDLNESQQDRIFDTLARRSPAWHPSMQPVGVLVPSGPFSGGVATTPGAGQSNEATGPEGSMPDAPLLDAIADELTPEQQLELADAELARQEWWEEIIPKLLPDGSILDTAAAIPGDSGTGTAAAAAPPPEEGPADTKAGDDAVILD